MPGWLLGLLLRSDGTPRYLVRKLLFDDARRPKRRFRSLVQRGSGPPRAIFREWMAAASVGSRLANRFAALEPLPVFEVPGTSRRIVAVVDSARTGGPGDIGAALILAALLAGRLGAHLCVATRSEPAAREDLVRFLQRQNVPLPVRIDFVHAPPGGANMPIGRDDLFVTSSWRNTQATLRSIAADRITYVVGEDERVLLPHGDELLRCVRMLGDPRLRLLVSTRLLFDHLAASGLADIAARGSWFEPAFPVTADGSPERADGRRSLLFHADPRQPQHLYHLGLEALDTALGDGVLDPAEWDIGFVGRDLEDVILTGGVKPRLLDPAALSAGAADLGLALNYAPHPGEAALAFAAAGAAVVTNQYGARLSLEAYSRNIICAPPDAASLVDALARGVALARDTARRRDHQESQNLGRDWTQALAPGLDAILHRDA